MKYKVYNDGNLIGARNELRKSLAGEGINVEGRHEMYYGKPSKFIALREVDADGECLGGLVLVLNERGWFRKRVDVHVNNCPENLQETIDKVILAYADSFK